MVNRALRQPDRAWHGLEEGEDRCWTLGSCPSSGFHPVWNRPDQWAGPGEGWLVRLATVSRPGRKALGAQGGDRVS